MESAESRAKTAPGVTVIIPFYNVENYLEKCLESLLRQTFSDWEAICVNDGSTDASPAILEKFAAGDRRFRVRNTPGNRGVSYARNRGLEMARGQYIYFLDSDDWILPEALRELYEIAGSERLDAVFFDTTPIYETEPLKKRFEALPYRYAGTYEGVMTGEAFFWEAVKNKDYTPALWRQFWRRDFLLENGGFFYEDPEICEDELFTHQMCRLAERVRCVKKAYHVYYRREGSITTAVSDSADRWFRSYFMRDCEILRFLSEHRRPVSEPWKAAFAYAYSLSIPHSLRQVYRRIENPESLSFKNPMHDIMYRRFRYDDLARQLALGLLQKEKRLCLCDIAWEKRLKEEYGLDLPHRFVIEIEPNRFELTGALRDVGADTLQVYFTERYEALKPVLAQAGFKETVDFIDGRFCLEG